MSDAPPAIVAECPRADPELWVLPDAHAVAPRYLPHRAARLLPIVLEHR